jgi:hypothetical protein
MSCKAVRSIDSWMHLEFGAAWALPPEADGDVMILAGDIITPQEYKPLRDGKPRILHAEADE